MIRILTLSIILMGTLFSDPVVLTFQNIDQDAGSLEIHYSSTHQISGFQMNVTGITLESVSTDLSFVEFSSGSGFVLAYLGGSGYLPASDDGVLMSIEFTPQGQSSSCLENIIIAGEGGASLDVSETECEEIPSAYTDCSGVHGGGDLPQEKHDCSGNCCTEDNLSSECDLWEDDYLVDCNGVCDGSAYFDTCDACSGGDTGHEEDSDMDCSGVCFGDAYIDACGECNSGAASCPEVTDLPDDQGYQVYITFDPSLYDDDPLRLPEGYTIERLDGDTWTSLHSFHSYGSESYQTVAATLVNSIEDDDGVITEENLTTFRIIAAMNEGNFATPSFTGTSTDNIHPAAPEVDALSSSLVDNHLTLSWEGVSDYDLSYYQIYLEDDENPIGYSGGDDFEASDVDDCYFSEYEFSVNSVDANQNTSDTSPALLTHEAGDYTIDLHYGANLVSFYALPDDVYIGNIMESLGDAVTGVIGEGVAATPNPVLGWVGSLENIDKNSGYWIKVDEACQLTISDAVFTGGYELYYDLHYGANLVSFPSPGSIGLADGIPDNIEGTFTAIIGEGVAASPNPVLGWVGSLTEFEGTKGYWIKVDEAGSLNYQICTP